MKLLAKWHRINLLSSVTANNHITWNQRIPRGSADKLLFYLNDISHFKIANRRHSNNSPWNCRTGCDKFYSRFDKSPTISHTRVYFLALIVKTARNRKKSGEVPVGNWWQLLFIDIRPKPPWKHFKISVKHESKSHRVGNFAEEG